jgi:FMN phosphatase YigB (HAD superfamily)
VARAHSFDVFDTLLVRTRARPVDVLRAAAELAVPGPPDRAGRAELVAELSRRRGEAEERALERAGTDAVGLDAIYAELDGLRALGVDPDDLRRAELEVEETEARPVRAGAERVRAARAAGERVLFVSDMYLPADRIRAALERFGIAAPDDPLYVSGELGVDKRRGGLFDHVLRAEGLAPGELVHTGDDPVTDIATPRARGIAVEPLTIGRLDRFEHELVANLGAPRVVAARLAGATRAARVAHAAEGGAAGEAEAAADGEAGAGAEAASVAANVAGPLFAGFVAWVLRRAREEGIERLYFVSRDAQVMLRVARALHREGDPELCYLYGSRQAWLLPGVERVDRESLRWLLEPEPAPPRALLAKLEIDAGEVADELRAHGLEPDQRLGGESLERLWSLLSAIEPLILERAARARALAADYLDQEGLRAPGRWALVDVGWRLTAQAALRRILAGDGSDPAPLGFYLGVSRGRLPIAEAGDYRAFLVEDDEANAGHLSDGWLWRSTSLVEQVLAIADHGSCAGYRRDGDRIVPVLRELPADPRRAALCECIQATVVTCAEELERSGLLDEQVEHVRAAGVLAGHLLVNHPTRAEAAALGWIPVTDDQNETRTRELAPPLALADVLMRSREKLGRPVERDFDTVSRWREASFELGPPAARAAFRALRAASRGLRRLRGGRGSGRGGS